MQSTQEPLRASLGDLPDFFSRVQFTLPCFLHCPWQFYSCTFIFLFLFDEPAQFEEGYLVNLEWLHTMHGPAGHEVRNVTDGRPEDLSHIYFKPECNQPWKIFHVS